MTISTQIAQTLNLKPDQVIEVLHLFSEDATIPFIARYRKEKTGYRSFLRNGPEQISNFYFQRPAVGDNKK